MELSIIAWSISHTNLKDRSYLIFITKEKYEELFISFKDNQDKFWTWFNQTLPKGGHMKRLLMTIGILSILATSANAGYWSHTPKFGGGWESHYIPSTTDILRQYGIW